MAERESGGALGVFAVGLLLVFVALMGESWWLLLPAACLIVGAVAATSHRRRTGPDPDVVLRPGGTDRPWRRRDER